MTPWTAACQAPLSFDISQSLLQFLSIESVMLSISSFASLLSLLPSVFPSNRVFSSESVLCIRWPKYWNFSFNTSPSNEYSGMISFRIDWFDLLAAQGIFKSLLQHHNLKASILWCSAFFMVQLTSLHDCQKNHGFDYKGLCWQSDVENLCPHKILPRDSHSETEQDPMVLSHCILHMTLWKNLNQRISLIKETRKCKNKGKQSSKTK